MTKIEKHNLDLNIAHAVFHKRKVVIDGQRIKGVMIGFIPEQPSDTMTVWWNIHDRQIMVSGKKVNK